MLKEFLEIGKILSTHGIKGELRLEPWCDSPDFLKQFDRLYFSPDIEGEVALLSARKHGNIAIIMLEGIDSIEKAARLKNKILYINRHDASLPDGQHFVQDLVDCTVIDADTGKKYGVLSDVSKTGANDVWHIRSDENKEYLIPVIDEVVDHIDTLEGIIKIRPLKGLFDDED